MNAVCEESMIESVELHSRQLLSALSRLDHLLQQAVERAEETYGSKAFENFRGLFVSHSDVEQLLTREPGAPAFRTRNDDDAARLTEPLDKNSQLKRLKQSFGLSDFDVDLICIALAPELDLRYERLYAYLQDDVTRRRPTVDLALNLLCDTPEDKLANRVHFAPDAPLFDRGLVHLFPDPHQTQPPLLAHYFKLDPQVVQLLLGQVGPDPRLNAFCRLVTPVVSLEDLQLSVETKPALPFLLKHAQEGRARMFYFQGKQGTGRRRMAEALASQTGASLLTVDLDLAQALTPEVDLDEIVKLICREARLRNAILYLDEFDVISQDPRHKRFLKRFGEQLEGVAIMAGTKPSSSLAGELRGVVVLPFPVPTFAERRTCWQRGLAAADVRIEESMLSALAGRFRLTENQITDALETARTEAMWRVAQLEPLSSRTSSKVQPTTKDLFAAARRQTRTELASLARKIESVQTWDDLVLPEDAMSQLREIVLRVVHRHQVLGEWGFDRKLSSGKGVNALFAGSSGTGKTMAAEVIANELGLELYKIDLAGVVSKYIGETEKNLERIFNAAEHANAILFFDEADALFGKRSEVHDAHDRYANIEVAYLLQKMEQYEGISLLATNLRQNMDEAFVRRLAFIVQFPVPNTESRHRIWQGIWPKEIALNDDVDLESIARQFKLSGGNIKNIALAAAFHAAADGGRISMSHLVRATRREFQKMGKVLPEVELRGDEDVLQS